MRKTYFCPQSFYPSFWIPWIQGSRSTTIDYEIEAIVTVKLKCHLEFKHDWIYIFHGFRSPPPLPRAPIWFKIFSLASSIYYIWPLGIDFPLILRGVLGFFLDATVLVLKAVIQYNKKFILKLKHFLNTDFQLGGFGAAAVATAQSTAIAHYHMIV